MPVLNIVHNDGLLLFVISLFVSKMKEVDKLHVYVGLPTLILGVFYNLPEINTTHNEY